MKPQFSEFTYGYTLIEELSRNRRFSAVPKFPSLIEEGRVGGYDVSLEISGQPFFLQFKRSDCMVRSNSKYYRLFGGSYYKFNIHSLRHSQQHNLLLEIERSGYPVCYVAPKFHTNKELHNNYFNSFVVSESIWVTPYEIGDILDYDQHSFCFNSAGDKRIFCSEPRMIESSIRSGLKGISEYLSSFAKQEQETEFRQNTWGNLYNQMENVVKTYDATTYRQISGLIQKEENIVLKTAKLSRLAFGVDMMIYKNS